MDLGKRDWKLLNSVRSLGAVRAGVKIKVWGHSRVGGSVMRCPDQSLNSKLSRSKTGLSLRMKEWSPKFLGGQNFASPDQGTFVPVCDGLVPAPRDSRGQMQKMKVVSGSGPDCKGPAFATLTLSQPIWKEITDRLITKMPFNYF